MRSVNTLLRILTSAALLFCCALTTTANGQAEEPINVGPEPATEPPPAETEEEVLDGLSSDDWISIRDAYEAGRHAAYPVEGGYQARNPGQQWLACFDGRGFSVEPDTGGWSWGLMLVSYGFADNEQVVTKPERVSAECDRVAYQWSADLVEWYINDTRGLEHGYTVCRPPSLDGRAEGTPLILTLALRGQLRPKVEPGGRGVSFLDESGGARLLYKGLTVFDADGRALTASFERVGVSLRLLIDESGARYPLTIDPVAYRAYLKASNTDSSDHFGSSVASSGDTVVIGALGEDSFATGVNSGQNNNLYPSAGAVYVFVKIGASWSQQAYIKASNTDAGDSFGASVAISEDTLVVGAVGEASADTGVNGDQGDNSASSAGAAYVFVRSGTTWSQQAYLKASNTDPMDMFGWSVGVYQDLVVVGAHDEDSNATGVNSGQNNNLAPESGAVYVFVRSGTTWSQQAYLKASNTDSLDHFGECVAASRDTVVVGAPDEASFATGVNSGQNNNLAPSSGAAYIFTRNGTSWSQQAYVKASNTGAGDHFGRSVAAAEETVVIGARREASSATGVNGSQGDNSANQAGAAYVFVRDGTSWSQQAYLKASNTEARDLFGTSVAISENTVVIGAVEEDSSAVGVNGNQSNNSVLGAGAAYVFLRRNASWFQEAYLKAVNTEEYDHFGSAVALSGDTAVVGAPAEDSAATGVNGDHSDNSKPFAGAAYLYRVDFPPGFGYCFGDPGSGQPCPCNNDNNGSMKGSGCANGAFATGARLQATGTPSVSNDSLALITINQDLNNTCLYFQADNAINSGHGIAFGDGLRCAGGGLIRLQVRTSSSSGASFTTIAIGAKGGVAPGYTKRYQCWYRDTSGGQPCGVGVNDFNLSNGYEITWLP